MRWVDKVEGFVEEPEGEAGLGLTLLLASTRRIAAF